MLILRLLDEKDMYGYEMIETLRSRSENVFELKAGSLYPLLHTLEANNLVTAYEDDASGKTTQILPHYQRRQTHFKREKRRVEHLCRSSHQCALLQGSGGVCLKTRKLYLDYIKILE